MFSSFMNVRNANEAPPPSPAITTTTLSGVNTPATTNAEATLEIPTLTDEEHFSMSAVDQLVRLHAHYERHVVESVHSAVVKVNGVSAEIHAIKNRLNEFDETVNRLVDMVRVLSEASPQKEPAITRSTPIVKSDTNVSRAKVNDALAVAMVISGLIGAFLGANAYATSLTVSVMILFWLFEEKKAKPAAKK